MRSSGSIGGGTRAYDDPAHRSSGSIGGEKSGYDSPEHKSSGSIGGAPSRVEQERLHERDTTQVRPLERLDDDGGNNRSLRDTESASERKANTRTIDDERFKSKGRIGG